MAVDIRATRSFLMLADPMGQRRSDIVSLPTVQDPKRLVTALARRIAELLKSHAGVAGVEQGGAAQGQMRFG